MRVWDAKGKEHLDAVSGAVWTVNVGYGRESIANVVRDQLIKMNYFAGVGGSIPGALFAERLISKMPGLTRVYYSNSGSEANEKVYKMVRQIAHRHHKRQEVEDPVPRPRLPRHHHRRAGHQRPGRTRRDVRALPRRLRDGSALPGIPQAVGRARTTASARPMPSRR
jgi:hypothetical protein